VAVPICCLQFESLESRRVLTAGVLISEFMASNRTTLADEDGDFSDWIEVHNPTAAPVDLTGAYLSDNSAQLQQWQFPSTVLQPDQYLLVFASGKNRALSESELHTNFRLSSSGGDVVLVAADGTTIVDAILDYRPQEPGITFGRPQKSNVLVDVGDSAKYLVPSASEAGLDWQARDFDDSAWTDRIGSDGPSDVLITEISTNPKFLEITNVTDEVIDTSGWKVLINDASAGLNQVNSTAWTLPEWLSPTEVLYRTQESTDNPWGSAMDWPRGGPGWAMILNGADQVQDFVAWGYTNVEIAALSVDFGSTTEISVGNRWTGPGVAITGINELATSFVDYISGPGTHANTTSFSQTGIFIGSLKDSLTGASSGNLIVTRSGVGLGSAGALPAAGSDAHTIFDDRVDMTSSLIELSGASREEFTFSNLNSDPNITYDVVGTASRGEASYVDRWTLVELVGANSAVPSHSVGEGVVMVSPTEVAIWSGANHEADQGLVARWVDVDPGNNNKISLVSTQYTGPTPGVGTGTAKGPTGYGLSAIRLVASDTSNETPLMSRTGAADNDNAGDFYLPISDTLGATHAGLILPFATQPKVVTPFGYGSSFSSLIATNVAAELQSVNSSLWTRIPFHVSRAASVSELVLRMQYDAGFAAYINGTAVASANVPGTLDYNSTATAERDDPHAIDFQDFDIRPFTSSLVNGTNVLAIHVLNSSASDNDLFMSSELSAKIELSLLATPTPGGQNSPILLEGVRFSHASGTFNSNFQLVITLDQPDQSIHYTLDGSVPTETSLQYTQPIEITASKQIRARTFDPSGASGPTLTRAFTRLDSSLETFSSDLPIVVLDNFGKGLPNRLFQDGFMTIYEPDDRGRSELTHAASFSSRVGIHRRGNTSFTWPQVSLRIELRDEAGNDRNESLLGMPAEADWILQAFYDFDRSLLRNSFMYEVSNSIGHYAPRTKFVEVYLNRNGGSLASGAEYMGVYILVEPIEIGPDRVNIQKLTPSDTVEPDLTGGYLFKVDLDDPGEVIWRTTRKNEGEPFVAVGPENPTQQQVNYIQNYLQQMEDAAFGANAGDPLVGFRSYIDTASFIDYQLLYLMTNNSDVFTVSNFWFKDRNGKLQMGPIWDFDRSMGSDINQTHPHSLWPEYFGYIWWPKFFDDEDFVQEWIDRWTQLREDSLNNHRVTSIIDSQQVEIAEAVVRNFQRWPEVAPDGGPFAQAGLTGWDAEVSHMRGWVETRLNHIDTFMMRPVMFNFTGNGGPGPIDVTLTAPRGTFQTNSPTIYFTLDGSDPRLAGGGISGSAIAYTGQPISIQATTHLVARAFDPTYKGTNSHSAVPSSFWSGPTEQVVSVGATPADAASLRITEINYNPHDAMSLWGDQIVDNDQFEFVELTNIGSQPIELGGVQLVQVNVNGDNQGVRFSFDPHVLNSGERVIVVKNVSAFESRYGTGLPLAPGHDGAGGPSGVYSGKLSNGGERLTLLDNSGVIIQQFDYDNNGNWPGRADGHGSSLGLIDAEGDYHHPNHWQSSLTFGGTPGASSATTVSGVVINEVLAHSDPPLVDTIELFNSSSATVDVSGWLLSDNNDDYLKYKFPPGTSIPAGGYLLLDESDFNAGGGLAPADFLLSRFGDDLTLVTTDVAGRPLHFVDRVEFNATLSGVSMGRLPNGEVDGNLLPQIRRTTGAANLGHRPGEIIISEVHYNPAAADDTGLEFLELYNTTDTAIDLDRWRVNGAVDYPFPFGMVLPAGETVVIVDFDPLIDTAAESAFRASYEIGAEVTITGPWSTSDTLDNGGERIDLERDTDHLEAGVVDYKHVLIDQVIYNDDSPWPVSPDGQGDALHRNGMVVLGNDSARWSAGVPTPGSVDFSAVTPGDFNGDGLVGATDINLLQAAVASTTSVMQFDLDSSTAVDNADVDHLVMTLLDTRYGDLDLDGDVDTVDLTTAIIQFTSAGGIGKLWESGDTDGDGDVDTSDMTTAIINFTGARAAVSLWSTNASGQASERTSATATATAETSRLWAAIPSSKRQSAFTQLANQKVLSWTPWELTLAELATARSQLTDRE